MRHRAVLGREFWGLREDGLGQSVMVKCPKCGLVGKISHDVDAQGRLEGGMSCPTVGCDFEMDVELHGWPQGYTAIDGSMVVIRIPKLTDALRRKLDA